MTITTTVTTTDALKPDTYLRQESYFVYDQPYASDLIPINRHYDASTGSHYFMASETNTAAFEGVAFYAYVAQATDASTGALHTHAITGAEAFGAVAGLTEAGKRDFKFAVHDTDPA